MLSNVPRGTFDRYTARGPTPSPESHPPDCLLKLHSPDVPRGTLWGLSGCSTWNILAFRSNSGGRGTGPAPFFLDKGHLSRGVPRGTFRLSGWRSGVDAIPIVAAHPSDFMISGMLHVEHSAGGTASGPGSLARKAVHRPVFQSSWSRVLHVEHTGAFGMFYVEHPGCWGRNSGGGGTGRRWLRALFCTMGVFRDVPRGTCKPMSLRVFHVEHP
jgi:hypothetical protein